jgi:hypothetical protein
MYWQNQYCENGILQKEICMFNAMTIKILHRDRKINPKIHKEAVKTLNSRSNPEQKEQL